MSDPEDEDEDEDDVDEDEHVSANIIFEDEDVNEGPQGGVEPQVFKDEDVNEGPHDSEGGVKSLKEEEDLKDTQEEGEDLNDSQGQQDCLDGTLRTPERRRWTSRSPKDQAKFNNKTSKDQQESSQDIQNYVDWKGTSIATRFDV